MTQAEQIALYIGEQCRKAGMTLAGAAGILANVEAESAFKSTNLQDSYERSLGMNDAQYTAAVDSGAYTRFASDAAGYGLCQWTAGDRKAAMLQFHRRRGKSIGDLQTQVEWMLTEIHAYSGAWNVVASSNNARECGAAVCKRYEIPADTENQANYRGKLAEKWYAFLAANAGAEVDLAPASEPESTATAPTAAAKDEDGIDIPKTWPPRQIDSHCTGWPEVKLLEVLLQLHGYNCLIDGIFEEALTEKVTAYQRANSLTADGVVGKNTWEALGVKMQ